MRILQGLATSPGIAMGTVSKLTAASSALTARPVADTCAEKRRVADAVEAVRLHLSELYEKTLAAAGEETAAIFDIHGMMLEDEDYRQSIDSLIEQESVCGEYAVYETGKRFSAMFLATGDDYMMARAADVVDISSQVIAKLRGEENSPDASRGPVLIAAEDLLPSQTVQLDKSLVLGFISRLGNLNSHASILARSLGIPAVAALQEGYDALKDGVFAILDGSDGALILEPDAETLAAYRKKAERFAAENARLQELSGARAETADGFPIELAANIGHPDEAKTAYKFNADGIGLFRSEFLYFESDGFPSEEFQYEAYKKTLALDPKKRVVIRTLDLGADKQAPYFELPHEENPAMGYRAIRICLDRTDIFITQLRALLRASAHGRLAVMFPMITTEFEVQKVFALLEQVKADLRAGGVPFSDDVEYGIMIETPAAVMIADRLARLVDFFSIGTNDLTQYTFAADRMNPKINELFNPGSPAILRMIRAVADAAHKNGIWVGICGESAGDPNLLPHYVAMGIDELSMSPHSLLRVKEHLRGLRKADCEQKSAAFLK
ncbi:MAG: phosphoenolpyruvate--protein phosphotransferase [Clostridiaceae bacterium]|nr:phosphoenolpyruvate--protein phosphotransferase [Eubacteriales bacterium]